MFTLCIPALAVDVPESAVVARTGNCGKNVKYVLSEDGTLTISGIGKMYNFDGASQPWGSNSKITAIRIAEGVTSIGSSAFRFASNLKDVYIADTVTTIGDYAFSGCNSLTTIALPDSIVEIGQGAFSYSTNIDSITLSHNLKAISQWAFASCKALSNITIPSSVTKIEAMAFYDCQSLTIVDCPESVVEIEDAFGSCTHLTTLKIRNRNCKLPEYGSIAPKSTIIYGYPGSVVEEYATRNNYLFRPLEGIKNGLVKEGNKTYYYENGEKQIGGFAYIEATDTYYYCSDKDGHILKGGTVKVDGTFYYLSAKDGHVIEDGWVLVNGARKYYAYGYELLTGFWSIGKQSYYFSVKDAHLMKGGLVTGPGGQQYYVSAGDGHAMKNGWAQGPNRWWYYVDIDGVVRDKVQQSTRPTYTPVL